MNNTLSCPPHFRAVGLPAVWTMKDFLSKPDYAVYLGAKRLHHIVKDRE
jgi:hypothetical protein